MLTQRWSVVSLTQCSGQHMGMVSWDGCGRRQQIHQQDMPVRTLQIQPRAEFRGLERWRWNGDCGQLFSNFVDRLVWRETMRPFIWQRHDWNSPLKHLPTRESSPRGRGCNMGRAATHFWSCAMRNAGSVGLGRGRTHQTIRQATMAYWLLTRQLSHTTLSYHKCCVKCVNLTLFERAWAQCISLVTGEELGKRRGCVWLHHRRGEKWKVCWGWRVAV